MRDSPKTLLKSHQVVTILYSSKMLFIFSISKLSREFIPCSFFPKFILEGVSILSSKAGEQVSPSSTVISPKQNCVNGVSFK